MSSIQEKAFPPHSKKQQFPSIYDCHISYLQFLCKTFFVYMATPTIIHDLIFPSAPSSILLS